jgi:hypothetical protein
MTLRLASAVNNRLPEWAGYPVSRVLCRRFDWHTLYCRGRKDHVRDDGSLIGQRRLVR